MKKVSCFFLLLFFLFFAREGQAVVKKNVPVKSMNDLIIQDGGRKKPFDTYARENLVKLTGTFISLAGYQQQKVAFGNIMDIKGVSGQ